jgi:hypothetical protein
MLKPGDIISGGATGGLWWIAGLSGAALMTSSVMLSFGYVWGTLFRNPQIIAYVKSELLEMFITAALLIVILAGVGALSTLTVGDVLPHDMMPDGVTSGTHIYDAAAEYYERVDADMSGWLGMNYVINMYIDQIASVTPYARPLGVGMVASPMAGFASPIKQLLYNMTVALSLAFIMNHAQLVVYVFAIDAFLKFYLPLGIFLRCFTPTRRIGGTLMGVSVAFLFVFPMLSLITYSMFYQSCGGTACGPLVTFNTMLDGYMKDNSQGGFMDNFSSFFGNNYSDVSGGVLDLMGGMFTSIGTVFQKLIGNTMLFLLIVPSSAVSWAFAIGFVIPTFNIIIFTQAARGLSRAFGEEVDITSLTRMI